MAELWVFQGLYTVGIAFLWVLAGLTFGSDLLRLNWQWTRRPWVWRAVIVLFLIVLVEDVHHGDWLGVVLFTVAGLIAAFRLDEALTCDRLRRESPGLSVRR